MRVWYYDIPAGCYTVQQIIDLSEPKQTYFAVYQTLRRLGVESYRLEPGMLNYNKRNEKVWIWKGAEAYLKMSKTK